MKKIKNSQLINELNKLNNRFWLTHGKPAYAETYEAGYYISSSSRKIYKKTADGEFLEKL